MKWIIQKDVLDGKHLTKKLAKQRGQDIFEFKYIPFENPKNLVPIQDEKSIFRGSLEMAEKLEDREDIVVFGNSKDFTYSNFYKKWRPHLLNKDVEYIKASEFSKKIFGNERIKFVRPDKGNKSFTGQCFKLDSTWKACKNFVKRNTDLNDWLVVSSKKDVGKEYRFVMYENTVLSGSQYYSENGVKYEEIGESHKAWKYIQSVITNVSLSQPFWVVDVCKYKNEYKVVELNSFSCASWYHSNRLPIFKKLKKKYD